MITPEQFVKDYQSYVKEWVHIRNSKNQTQVNAEDLWEKLLAKITINNILDMYYDDHVSTASFKTWLNKVLNNLYIDMAIAIANKEWVPISVGDSEENFGYAIDQDKLAGSKQKTEIDFEGLEIDGDIIKPDGAIIRERGEAKFNPLIGLRTDFSYEMKASVNEIK